MKNKNILHECEGCHRRDMLEAGKRHWCNVCNPTAPFYMLSVKSKKQTTQLLKEFGIK